MIYAPQSIIRNYAKSSYTTNNIILYKDDCIWSLIVTIAISKKALATLCCYSFLNDGIVVIAKTTSFQSMHKVKQKYLYTEPYWSPPLEFLYNNQRAHEKYLHKYAITSVVHTHCYVLLLSWMHLASKC